MSGSKGKAPEELEPLDLSHLSPEELDELEGITEDMAEFVAAADAGNVPYEDGVEDDAEFAAKSVIGRAVASQRGWQTRRRKEAKQHFESLKKHQSAARQRATKDFIGLHKQVSKEIEGHAADLLAGRIDDTEFRTRMRASIKPAYEIAAELGKKKARGGDFELSTRDQAAVNRERYDEHKFLDNFVADIQGKYQGLKKAEQKARIEWRAGMYADALQGVANDSFLAHIPEDMMARWVMHPAEHCETCVAEASKGWRLRKDFTRTPGDGSTRCVTNCRCSIETKDGLTSMPAVEPRSLNIPPEEVAAFEASVADWNPFE